MISVTLDDVGVSGALFVRPGEQFSYSVDLSGDFDGVLKLKRSSTGGQTWDLVETIAADIASKTRVEESRQGALYRFEVELGAEETLTGDAAVTLADVADVLAEWKGKDGSNALKVLEDGIETPKLTATEIAGGKLTALLTTALGVGAKAGATVSVAEYGDGLVHKTVLTLTATPVPIESVTTGNGVGGVKVYDLPEGRILMLGCMADLALAIAVAEQGNFTDATPEGDLGVGTVAPANADALGTDATDDDFATSTPFTMSAYAATAKAPSEPVLQHNGTSTPKEVLVNVLVDAADIDDDAETEILVSGTITLHWINLGDF